MAAFGSDLPVVDLSGSFLDRVLRSLRSLRSLARCARLTVMKQIILEASWDLLEVVSNGVVLFLTVSVLLPKIIQKSTPKLPKSSPKPSRIHPKTFQNPPKNAPKTRSGGDCASDRFWAFFLSDLWASWAVSGASWDHLGAVLGRLAASWSRPGTTSGRSWAVLGTS